MDQQAFEGAHVTLAIHNFWIIFTRSSPKTSAPCTIPKNRNDDFMKSSGSVRYVALAHVIGSMCRDRLRGDHRDSGVAESEGARKSAKYMEQGEGQWWGEGGGGEEEKGEEGRERGGRAKGRGGEEDRGRGDEEEKG